MQKEEIQEEIDFSWSMISCKIGLFELETVFMATLTWKHFDFSSFLKKILH